MPIAAIQAAAPITTSAARPTPDSDLAQPAQAAGSADTLKLSQATPAPIKAVGTAVKIGGQVATGAAGAAAGAVVGAGFSAIATPIAGAEFLSERSTGLAAAGLALLGFVGGLVAAPVMAVVGAVEFGYIGARSGADLVDKAVDPKHVNLGQRLEKHFADVDNASGKVIDKILD